MNILCTCTHEHSNHKLLTDIHSFSIQYPECIEYIEYHEYSITHPQLLLLCVLVCIYVLGGKGKLAEPLRQVVHSYNTNGVKFLSCHRNKDGDSSLSFSQTT